MTNAARISVELDMSELVTSHVHETRRDRIDDAGARGVWDGFGQVVVKVNDHNVLALHLHEDRQGRVVLEVSGLHGNEKVGIPTVYELQRDGIVPPRTTRKGR